VKSYPPETHKEFEGVVVNVTIFETDGKYIVHYIRNTTNIWLVARDNGTGVNVTYYRIFKLVNGKWILLHDWHEYGIWKAYWPYYPINLAELGLLANLSACGKYEIEFYSIDKNGNMEAVKWNDVFVDCYAPYSVITELDVEGKEVYIYAQAYDEGVGVENISLYYRYSPDNATWENWTFYSNSTNGTWHIILQKDGYYEFYTVAYDKVGNRESFSGTEARCKIFYPWDVNQDGIINIIDIYYVVLHWMETPASPEWYERADVNKDDIVNVLDIIAVAQHWTG